MAPSVRHAASRDLINPDVDPAFHDLYEDVTERLARVYGTDDDVVVLGGEGILGLEAAVASLVAPGDEVVCLANGVYGHGFADLVEGYGGHPVVVESGVDDPLDAEGLSAALDEHDPVAVTMVHCETPTGALNDLDAVLDLVTDSDALAVVDAVSSLGGVDVPTERTDVCLAASQKCLSAPPGLATAAVSDAAWDRIEERDVGTLYTNLTPWRETRDGFPYTHLATLVAALDEALDLYFDEGAAAVHDRHERAAERCRERGSEIGLDLVAPARPSPTVTAFEVPGRAVDLQRRLHETHDITLATGVGDRADDVIRVGHMGYNADVARVERTMNALSKAL